MQWFQSILVGIYGIAQRWGWLESAWFKRVFQFAYFRYKRYMEDPFYALTQRYPQLFQGGHILDIGANIGYTAVVFAGAVDSDYNVYAFEPDRTNIHSLKEIIEMQRVQSTVVPICAAVGEKNGFVDLWHNDQHHADHRIVTDTYKTSGIDSDRISTVEVYSVDEFVKDQAIADSIRFIKIDVQGYELLVCQGMERTLERNPDLVIAIEYSPDSLIELGFDPTQVLSFFCDRHYHLYQLTQRGTLAPVQLEQIDQLVQNRGYVDLLCSQQIL